MWSIGGVAVEPEAAAAVAVRRRVVAVDEAAVALLGDATRRGGHQTEQTRCDHEPTTKALTHQNLPTKVMAFVDGTIATRCPFAVFLVNHRTPPPMIAAAATPKLTLAAIERSWPELDSSLARSASAHGAIGSGHSASASDCLPFAALPIT